jgi:hypothetical protein
MLCERRRRGCLGYEVRPVIPLREVADIASGITLGRKTRQTNLVPVLYLRVANVQDGRLNLSEVKSIDATPQEGIAPANVELGRAALLALSR